MVRPRNGTKTIASVEKAIKALEIIAHSESGLTVTEISHALGGGVSATYHLLNTLRQNDLIYQEQQTKKYTMGLAIFKLHALAQKQNTLISVSQPYLDSLSRMCGETSNLLMLQDGEAVYVAQSESNHMVKMFTQIGAKVPYYCTGGGKVIAALRSKEEREALAKRTEFVPFTKHTIASTEALLRELDVIRAQGYGYDREEREEGVICIAAPIFSASAEPIAAMSISGPRYRIEDKGTEKLTEVLLQTTREMSARFGYKST